jgi:MFS family permease
VPDARRAPSLPAVVTALGIAQIVSWGTLFYTIAVLGPALREATGVGELLLYAAYSAGLFVSGIAAPRIGREIDARGGRPVLAGGSVLAVVACAALALVQGPVSLVLAWLLAGIAMSATLYDPAFATLHHVAGASYRRSVTVLTLWGGFASTLFWPLSQLLVDAVGVRWTFALYAVLHLVVCLPLHVRFLPRERPLPEPPREASAAEVPVHRGAVYFWLAAALSLASVIASGLAAHLIGMITASGLSAREAVAIGALIGPMQVAGRMLEWMLGRRISAITAGTLSFAALAASLVAFAAIGGHFAIAVVFAILYGLSNGVMTIVRGTVPAELFGRRGYGALLGRLAMPQFVARALAPAVVAVVLVADPGQALTLATFVALGIAALVAYQRAVVLAARGRG